MSTQYDNIASEYAIVIDDFPAKYADEYTFFNLLGDVTGKSVLDIGCGTGMSTRPIKQMGAARVVGMDISSEMLKLAQCEEQRCPLGIEYVQGDMCDPIVIGYFDLVVALSALAYSPTRNHLLKACQMIINNLKAGGRFVTLLYEYQPPEVNPRLEKYGFIWPTSDTMQEGDVCTSITRAGDHEFVVRDHYYRRTTYEWALRTAGFQTIRWHRPMVSPEGLQRFGEEFWQDFLDYEVCIVLECAKGV